MPKQNEYEIIVQNIYDNNTKYLQSKNCRKSVVASFYFIALIYAIVHDVMDRKEMHTDILTECADIDYPLNTEDTTFYNEDRKNLFVFVMLIDLVLFGELFGSHNIMLNPIYWLVKSAYNTKSIRWTIISFLFIFGSIILFVLLFLKYDIGLL